MTALARLFRTTAFRLSIVYLTVFALLAVFLIIYIGTSTTTLLNRQVNEAIESEIVSLAEVYERGGVRQLVEAIERRSRRPGASLYVLTDPAARTVVGNVAEMPLAVLGAADGRSRIVSYQRLDAEEGREYRAMVRVFVLPGGLRILVGRDIGEGEQFRSVMRDAFRLAVVVIIGLGLASWWFVHRYVLRRVDAMARTTDRIMAGDLGRRLELTGSGDEFDRLGQNLNAMLDRIEQLINGLKEVSDNIAHDLKTPLTRLRTRVEAALRADPGGEDYRATLEATIEDADQLIAIFDALLRIARVEAGASGEGMADLDAAAILADVAELYEPVAEEAGLSLTLYADSSLAVRGNRELISQAMTNLVDNAIKYAGEGGATSVRLVGRLADGRVRLSVIDDGAGIAESERARAVERFVRLEASRTKPGSGLGLSLVAAVSHLHGGHLELNDAGPGLEATMDLPAQEGPAEHAAGGRANGAGEVKAGE